MRQVLIAAALGVSLGLVGWSIAGAGTGPGSALDVRASANVVAFQVAAGDDSVHLYIVDGKQHWFGVYQIDLNRGDCRLKVARDFSGDIELLEWGQHEPAVRAVKSMVGRVDRVR